MVSCVLSLGGQTFWCTRKSTEGKKKEKTTNSESTSLQTGGLFDLLNDFLKNPFTRLRITLKYVYLIFVLTRVWYSKRVSTSDHGFDFDDPVYETKKEQDTFGKIIPTTKSQ